MTDRIHSCKESPNGRHAIDTLQRECRWCHRTLNYLLDMGWNVPKHDPDAIPLSEVRTHFDS